MRKKIMYATLLLCTLALGSCGKRSNNGEQQESNATETTTGESAEATSVVSGIEALDGEWQLLEVRGKEVAEELRPTIHFDIGEMRFYGNLGCNDFNGTIELPNNGVAEVGHSAISFGQVASTRMLCEEEKMELEAQISAALEAIASYQIAGEQLMLADEQSNTALLLQRQ